MQHSRADDQIETLVQLAGVLDLHLSRFEIRQVVLLLQTLGVFETRRADVNADHARLRMTERVLGGLECSASRHEHVEIGALCFMRKGQRKLRARNNLVLPQLARAVEVVYRRRIRMTRVEVADRIGAGVWFRSHKIFREWRNYKASTPNRANNSRRPAFVTCIARLSRSRVTHFLLSAVCNNAEPKAPPMCGRRSLQSRHA